jgi:tetratricopeptide (TPR) repeat protein
MNQLNIGLALSELGNPSEAMAALQRALTIWQKLDKANPTDILVKQQLAQSYNAIGELQALIGRPGDALKSHEKARDILIKPVEVHTASHTLQGVLATSLYKTGLLLSATEKPTEGLASCQQALAIRQKLSDAQPELTWLRSELAGTFLALGIVQRRADRPAEAAVAFRHAISLLHELPTLTPRNLYSLACCHTQLAGVAAEAGSGLTAEQGVAEAARAMTVLSKAVATGYGGIAHLRADVYLDAIRPREDFQKLLKEQEAKAPKTLELAPPPREK